MNPASSTPPPVTTSGRSGVWLVLVCTLLGAAAQILMKTGGTGLTGHSLGEVLTHPVILLRNAPLLAGYCLYGLSTVLLVLALRKGQLSILYPVISLTYVWVLILSAAIFRENLNAWKLLGVGAIVAGVGVLGRDAQS